MYSDFAWRGLNGVQRDSDTDRKEDRVREAFATHAFSASPRVDLVIFVKIWPKVLAVIGSFFGMSSLNFLMEFFQGPKGLHLCQKNCNGLGHGTRNGAFATQPLRWKRHRKSRKMHLTVAAV